MPPSVRSLAPALAIIAALVVLDVAVGGTTAFVPLLVVAPLLAAATAGARGAAIVGLAAIAAAVVLGIVAEEITTGNHLVAISTVAAGTGLAGAVAGSRERQREAREAAERTLARADLLARASALFESGTDPLDHLEAVAALPVPMLADVCIADIVRPDGSIAVAGVAARDSTYAGELRRNREAHPVRADSEHPVAVVLRTGQPLLVAGLDEAQLRRWATSEAHHELIRRAGYESLVVVPLSARGRTIGTLALVRQAGTPRYEQADLEVAAGVARRAGLAIDHARLGREVGAISSDLQAVIGALTEAITVQAPTGQLLYANEAAARLSGFDTVEEMLRADAATVLGRWDVRDEDGEPVAYERLPGPRALAGEPDPEMLVQLIDRDTGERRWRMTRASPVLGPDGRPRLAVSVVEDVTEQRRRELAQTFLARASKLLTASLDPEHTLREVAGAAVPELADWCAVDMPDERGVLRRVATADRAPERTRIATLVIRERAEDPGVPVGPPQVMRTGTSELYPDITEELLRIAARDPEQLEALRAVGARSVLIVPMTAGGRTIGTITMGTIESERRLTTDDLLLAEELGRRAGIAVEHARVHREHAGIASTLQAALLPPTLPDVPGVEVAARFRAAGGGETVGGDFYDVFELPGEPRAWMVVMGDVTGKGPAAAAITALARHTIRAASFYERDPSRLLERLNQVLLDGDDRRRLCTAVCARVEPRAGAGGATMTLASAGHPLPLRSRPGGAVDALGRPGTLLGAFAEGRWADVTVELGPGDDVVLYTDGVTDVRAARERFGAERLRGLVGATAGHPAGAVATAIVEALVDFQDRESQHDDIALLVLRVLPA